jgi:pimeloyl-ACP methyl ester carboxylesterase
VVWVHPAGKASLFEKGGPAPGVRQLLDAGFGVLAPDLLGTGESVPEKPFAVDQTYAGYTFCYNRPLLANRVRDVLSTVAFARSVLKAKAVHLAGWGEFGPAVVLAKAAAGDAVGKTAADLNRFRFDGVRDTADPMMLPGAVKYGDVPAFLAQCAPGPVLAYNPPADPGFNVRPEKAYETAGAKGKLTLSGDQLTPEKVAGWLVT